MSRPTHSSAVAGSSPTRGEAASLLGHAPRDECDSSSPTHASVTLLGDVGSAERTAFLHQRYRTSLLVNLVSVMERMDEQILPAVSRFLGCAWDARPHQLGQLTFARALVQALSSPLGGVLGALLSCMAHFSWPNLRNVTPCMLPLST
jgi:hypothetical protein